MYELRPATRSDSHWVIDMLELSHYLRKAPDRRSRPYCYALILNGKKIGCLVFGRPESTRCYAGGLTYGSQEDVRLGRAVYDRWEVLNLSRVWLSPDVQPGGRWYSACCIPGFTDRKGAWRSSLASDAIWAALRRIGFDYLKAHPPCFPDQPYQIRAVLSYCDTRLHKGTIYRASGFSLARTNERGIETWWTPAVAPLLPEQDAQVRELAAWNRRSVRIRERERSLFQEQPK